MAEGLIVRLSNAAEAGQPSVLIDDINDATDGPDHGRVQAGAVYVAAQGSTDLVLAGDVARSFESGTIRGFINAGVLTASVIKGDAVGETVAFVVDAGTDVVCSALGKVIDVTIVTSGAVHAAATADVSGAASILNGAAPAALDDGAGDPLDGALSLTLADTAADVAAGDVLTLALVSAGGVQRATFQITFAGADA
ncbi:MAG: hypothetical protein VXX11_03155 [Planctomycetota bacterium]|nr:hypothetical protein [Planctomycetota bacterium]